MPKRLELTEDIKSWLTAAYGDKIDDFSQFAVFEAVALNTYPLRRRSGFWQKARFTASTLMEMSNYLQSGEAVPFLVMHNDGALPVGKVFYGNTQTNADGEIELRVLFYLPADSEQETIQKVESGVADEVSVGLKPKSARCSECGWDYFGEDASFINLLEGTCNNEHTIGVDGVHVIASGMETWAELSLVGRGAAEKPKVVSRSNSSFTEQEQQRIAASGFDPSQLYFFGSAQNSGLLDQSPKRGKTMADETLTSLVGELTDVKAKLQTAEASIQNKDQEIETLKASKEELEGKLKEFEGQDFAKLTQERDEAVQAKDTAEQTVKTARDFVGDLVKRAAVAAGENEPDVENMSLEDMQKSIQDSQAQLKFNVPVGGASTSADSEPQNDDTRRLSAFKTASK